MPVIHSFLTCLMRDNDSHPVCPSHPPRMLSNVITLVSSSLCDLWCLPAVWSWTLGVTAPLSWRDAHRNTHFSFWHVEKFEFSFSYVDIWTSEDSMAIIRQKRAKKRHKSKTPSGKLFGEFVDIWRIKEKDIWFCLTKSEAADEKCVPRLKPQTHVYRLHREWRPQS